MKTLVILSAGDDSRHRTWELERRNFDFWISYFGNQENRFREDADVYQQKKGFKYPVLHELLSKRAAELEQYDYIACPDEDLAWSCEKFHRAFELMRIYSLDVAQPGITG